MPIKTALAGIAFMLALASSGLQSEAAATTESRQTAVATTASTQKRVEIYVTDWCGYCEKALRYLKRKGIPHVAYDIEKDAAAKRRYQALGGRGVPFMVIGTDKLSGFSPEGIEYYLNK